MRTSPLAIAVALDLDDAFDHAIARGIARYANQQADWQLHGYGWMFRPLKVQSWRGVGAIARVTSHKDARRIAALGVPVVDVAGAVAGYGFTVVRNDDHLTGRWAGEHFAATGIRHAAFCGVRRVAWSDDRLQGFQEGLGRKVHRCFRRPLLWWRQAEVGKELAPWLHSLPAPCALMASHDLAALRITQTCVDNDLPVPGRIAVIGVDNEEVACELSTPPLASIPINAEGLGYLAAETLARRLAGKRVTAEQQLPPQRPVLRASAAIPQSTDPVIKTALQLIHDHACEGWNVADVVQAMACSRRYLELRFAQELGISPLQALTLVRLRKARALLGDERRSIATVAQRCGYSDPRSLQSAMSREWGISPSELRRTYSS